MQPSVVAANGKAAKAKGCRGGVRWCCFSCMRTHGGGGAHTQAVQWQGWEDKLRCLAASHLIVACKGFMTLVVGLCLSMGADGPCAWPTAALPARLWLQEDVYSARSSEGMCDVVLAVASVAKSHLDEARALAGRVPREVCAGAHGWFAWASTAGC